VSEEVPSLTDNGRLSVEATGCKNSEGSGRDKNTERRDSNVQQVQPVDQMVDGFPVPDRKGLAVDTAALFRSASRNNWLR
jgi:hypothetical protein